MNKTLHQKLSDKAIYSDHFTDFNLNSVVSNGFQLEKKIAEGLNKELLSPRPEAISRLLELSRNL
jgi:hypothetical protein